MDFPEYTLAGLIVIVLLSLAGFVGFRQLRALRRLRTQPDLPPEDRRYFRTQAWRRLVSCGLMLILAGLLVASYGLGQERRAREIGQERQAQSGAAAATPTPEQKQFLSRYGWFWIVFSLIFLAWVGLAFLDVWAIHRFGMRHLRQLQADRRAMIEQEVARFHHQHNEHG